MVLHSATDLGVHQGDGLWKETVLVIYRLL